MLPAAPPAARNIRQRLIPVVERGVRRDWRQAYASWASGEPNALKRARVYKVRGRVPNQTTMAKRSGGRYTRRTRRYRRRRRGIVKRRIPRTLAPKFKMIKVKAVETKQLTSATGALTVFHTQLNSFDDPFVGSGAGQPLGYDQYAALYEYAHVVASKVVVRIWNSGSTSVIFGITPIPINQGTTSLDNNEHYMESPGTVCRLISPDVDHATVVNKISCKKFFGISKILDTNEYRLNLTDETPPSKLAYWHLWMQSQDQATSGGATCTVTMEYIAILHDYKLPARSVES